jgi:hypothetical protein
MTPLDLGPYKVSPLQRWRLDTKYRILKAASAGRPLEPLRHENGTEMRFDNRKAAIDYLLTNGMVTP